MQKDQVLQYLSREDSLDKIQKYVENHVNVDTFEKQNVSSEMFRLFFNVIELGKEIRISIKDSDTKNSETKIADIFLVLVSICNSLQINLFDVIENKIL